MYWDKDSKEFKKSYKERCKKNKKFLKQHASAVQNLEQSGKFVNLSKKRRKALGLAAGLLTASLSLGVLGGFCFVKTAKDACTRQGILNDLGYDLYAGFKAVEFQSQAISDYADRKISFDEFQERIKTEPYIDPAEYVKQNGTEEQTRIFEDSNYDPKPFLAISGIMMLCSAGLIAATHIVRYTTPSKEQSASSDAYATRVLKGEIDPTKQPQFAPSYDENVGNYIDF